CFLTFSQAFPFLTCDFAALMLDFLTFMRDFTALMINFLMLMLDFSPLMRDFLTFMLEFSLAVTKNKNHSSLVFIHFLRLNLAFTQCYGLFLSSRHFFG